jgi:hypothetical protein
MSLLFTIITCLVISITGWCLTHPPKTELITPSHPSQRFVHQEVKTVISEEDFDTFLPPELRDHGLEADLNRDEPSYSSKDAMVYSSKDCYSSKDAKGVIEPMLIYPDVLDNMWIITMPPIPPPSKPPVTIDPHVITDVDPPIQ